MAAAMCTQSPERVPGARPARLPTVDTSWHGNPPMRMSTGSTWLQSMVVMSPRFGTSGQWLEKTRATGSLISENHGLGVEDVLDGEVEAAVAAEQRSDPEF